MNKALKVAAYVRVSTDKDDQALLEEVIFDRLYWDELDKGTISNEQTLKGIKSRIPERLWELADKIYYNWIYNIPEIDGMSELIDYIKSKGIKTYLLSNISKYFAEHINEVPILNKLDGLVMSGPIGIVKPSQEIFSHLCQKFDILPSESIFIDDRNDNIEGARKFGIQGYVFDGNAEKLREYLNEIL